MKIPFTKMSGAGNDFILVDNRSGNFPVAWDAFAAKECSRRTGIGADGLLVLSTTKDAPFILHYFNADGSSGSMCGNGGRCAAAYLMADLNLPAVDIAVIDYLYHADAAGENVKLRMKNPSSLLYRNKLNLFGQPIVYSYCNSGSPHVVIYYADLPKPLLDEIGEKGIQRIGRAIRMHEAFAPGGANVNFIAIKQNGRLSMRTYERGVEDETLACGTGAVACSVISAGLEELSSPVTVETSSGEELKVSFTLHKGDFTNVWLEGSARKIFEGVVVYEG
jgi:diaminopimelate epimerase